MSRGLAWALGTLTVVCVLVWQVTHFAPSTRPLPLLYTLGGDFALPSTNGSTTRLLDFRGDLVLLNFGYTSCPEVCPTALARMRDVLSMLPEGRTRVHPVFVTLDPEVDTVDRLQPYLQFFDSAFIGLTGTPAQIAQTAADYNVFYEREPMNSLMGYSISHSSHIYLLDGQGRVRATFGEGVPVPQIANTVYQLLGEEVQLDLAKRSLPNGA
jgi:protein SCO1/2